MVECPSSSQIFDVRSTVVAPNQYLASSLERETTERVRTEIHEERVDQSKWEWSPRQIDSQVVATWARGMEKRLRQGRSVDLVADS